MPVVSSTRVPVHVVGDISVLSGKNVVVVDVNSLGDYGVERVVEFLRDRADRSVGVAFVTDPAGVSNATRFARSTPFTSVAMAIPSRLPGDTIINGVAALRVAGVGTPKEVHTGAFEALDLLVSTVRFGVFYWRGGRHVFLPSTRLTYGFFEKGVVDVLAPKYSEVLFKVGAEYGSPARWLTYEYKVADELELAGLIHYVGDVMREIYGLKGVSPLLEAEVTIADIADAALENGPGAVVIDGRKYPAPASKTVDLDRAFSKETIAGAVLAHARAAVEEATEEAFPLTSPADYEKKDFTVDTLLRAIEVREKAEEPPDTGFPSIKSVDDIPRFSDGLRSLAIRTAYRVSEKHSFWLDEGLWLDVFRGGTYVRLVKKVAARSSASRIMSRGRSSSLVHSLGEVNEWVMAVRDTLEEAKRELLRILRGRVKVGKVYGFLDGDRVVVIAAVEVK